MVKKRQYDKDTVIAAVEFAKENKKMSVRKVAREFGIPETTLRNKLNGKFAILPSLGRPAIIPFTKEKKLAEHCAFMAQMGYGYTKWQVIELALELANTLGVGAQFRNSRPSKHWFYGFLGRFPDMKMSKPQKLERIRAISVTPVTIQAYYNELRHTLERNGLFDQPSRIWNVDETGITCDHSPPKILASRFTRVHAVTNGKSPTTTVIACGNALGHRLPPYVIYKGERLCQELVDGGLPGTRYTATKTGWSNSETFLDFFKNHFIKHVTTPAIVLYDGHLTHMTLDVLSEARMAGIEIFVLPPHSSHILQPLDVGIFSPFKRTFSALCHKYVGNNINNVITRYQLPQLIGKSYDKAMSPINLQGAFRKAGVCPFYPQKVISLLPKKMEEKDENTNAMSRKERMDHHKVKKMLVDKEKSVEINRPEETPMKENDQKQSGSSRRLFIPKCGKAITTDEFFNIVKERDETCRQTSQAGKGKKRKIQAGKNNSQEDKLSNGEEPSQEPGPSGLNKNPSNDCIGTPDTDTDLDDTDDEVCCVCGQFSPPAFKMNPTIKIVDWGCCDRCDQWVHLEYCTSVRKLSNSQPFRCPFCPTI